ncbi:trypsin-like cysteine/serine peptidase domain-containing protein [Baffinella frigidus]|nr:trypsin-like cysteine/serine peptidase domain-containing protein [Cryptophyta sp. CCMP2293]
MVGEVGRSWGAGLRVALSVLVLICLCDGALNGAGEEAPWAEAARVHRSLRQPSSGTMHNMEGDKHAAALRILGGQHEQGYPWAVLIDKIGGGAITCTGSIIAKKWVVTAAHCVLNNQDNGYKSASWGTTIKFNCFYLLDGACRSMSVLRHVPHPCYFPSYDQDHDDIVLFELESEIADIPPILVDGIDGTPPWKVGSDVTLAGFGVVDNANFHRSTWLMAVDVPLATQSECARTNPSALNHKYINFSHVICTGGHAGKDSCAGDSVCPSALAPHPSNLKPTP